jgi:hypothetical protein
MPNKVQSYAMDYKLQIGFKIDIFSEYFLYSLHP